MFMQNLVRFAQKNAVAVIIGAISLTLFFGFFTSKIRYDANIINLLPKKKTVPSQQSPENETDYEHIILFVESEDVFTLEGLSSLENTIDKISDLPDIAEAVTPFNYLTFKSDNGMVGAGPLSPEGRAPTSSESLAEYKRAIVNEPLARNLVISNDLSTLGAIFFVRRMEDYSNLIADVEQLAADLEPHFAVHIAGRMTVIEAAKRNLMSDVPRFFIPGILLILLIFYLGFRTARSVFLPVATVFMGTIWTLGVMSLAGLKLSVISIMVPPLVLALGSSYSIHILSQYYLAASGQNEDKKWIAGSIAGINVTILLAALTSIIGFLSLLTASMPQIREFGLATSIGIVFCLVLSMLFIPAVLTLMHNPKQKENKRISSGFLLRLMDWLSVRVVLWRYAILVLLVIVTVLFIITIPQIRYQTDYTSYEARSDTTSSGIDDYLYSTRKFGGFVFVYITLSAPGKQEKYFLQQDALRPVADFEKLLSDDPDVAYITSFTSYLRDLNRVLTGSPGVPDSRGPILLLSRFLKSLDKDTNAGSLVGTLFSPDFDRLTIALRIYNGAKDKPIDEVTMNRLIDRIYKYIDETLDPETTPYLWGDSLAYLSISEILSRDQIKSVAVSVFLVMLVTVFSFRSIKFGLLALVPMLMGIMLTIIAMNAFKIPFDVVTVMFTSVAIGVGIDDSIHLILQYRKQARIVDLNIGQQIQRTMRVSGKPILLTSASLVGGLLVLSFSGFLPIVYFGLLISLVLVSTTFGALVILPALLTLFFRKSVSAGFHADTATQNRKKSSVLSSG